MDASFRDTQYRKPNGQHVRYKWKGQYRSENRLADSVRLPFRRLLVARAVRAGIAVPDYQLFIIRYCKFQQGKYSTFFLACGKGRYLIVAAKRKYHLFLNRCPFGYLFVHYFESDMVDIETDGRCVFQLKIE
jgi:hypothetical protein